MFLLFATTCQADVSYVALDGSHTAPFLSWESAATNIQAAIESAADGDTVLVAEGVYQLQRTLTITKGVHIKAHLRRDLTVLQGKGVEWFPCFLVDHPQAILNGFSVANGWGKVRTGGGGTIRQGVVQSCTIKGNRVGFNAEPGAGGVFVDGGMLLNCTILENEASGPTTVGVSI